MKRAIKYSVAIILMIFTHTSSFAQETNAIRFGVKGGVNFSSLYTEDSENDKMLMGFNAGFFSKMPITGGISIQPELYYTAKGAEVTYNNSFVDGTARFRMNYLEVPLLVVVNVTDNFNIHAGPYAAFLLSGKVTNESDANLFDFEDNIDAEDYNRLDAGFAAGAGLDIGAVSLGVRYNYGLTKVGKERTYLGTSYTFPDASNGVLNFYVALSLN